MIEQATFTYSSLERLKKKTNDWRAEKKSQRLKALKPS